MSDWSLVSIFMDINGDTFILTTLMLFFVYIIVGVSVFLYNVDKEWDDD